MMSHHWLKIVAIFNPYLLLYDSISVFLVTSLLLDSIFYVLHPTLSICIMKAIFRIFFCLKFLVCVVIYLLWLKVSFLCYIYYLISYLFHWMTKWEDYFNISTLILIGPTIDFTLKTCRHAHKLISLLNSMFEPHLYKIL